MLSLSQNPVITSNASQFHKQSSFSNHRRTAKSHLPSITCNVVTDRHEKPLPNEKPNPAEARPRSSFSRCSVSPVQLNPIQKVTDAALDMLEKSFVKEMEKKRMLNPMVDPAVQLEGNHEPVQECPVLRDLEVEGTIPRGVEGVYLRNGGNPFYPPTSGHHFFDGDGMIHAVSLGAGNRASYACRFTRTNRLLREAALGKPAFPKPIGELHGHSGLARLALFAARALFGLIDATRGVGVANISVVYFNGRLLAMSEDDLPYRVRITSDGDLETIGRHDFNGQVKNSMIAHPKEDPVTGNLYTLSYNVLLKPYLKFLRFDKWGNKKREVAISIPRPVMIHDFAISENHIIIPDHQMIFKLTDMIRGGSPVLYDKNKVSRFGVMPKDATHESMIQWIDVPDYFCFHIYNAWEEYDENGDKVIVVINSRMTPPDSIFSGGDNLMSELSEIRLNLTTGKSTTRTIIPGVNLEAGQVNKQLLGKKSRYVYLALAEPWPKCGGIARVDLETGSVKTFLYGGKKFGGEPCFVPAKAGEDDEEEGFLMCFVRDEENETSEFVIVKASTMEQVALIKMPRRVPYGFHGTFVSSEELRNQVFN